MTVVLGITLGIGALLVVAPWLWPSTPAVGHVPGAPRGMTGLLARAGLVRVNPATVAVVSVMSALAAAAVVFTLAPVLALAGAAGAVALVLPSLLLVRRARQRQRATRVVWPDIVDHLISAVRSGLALPDGVAALAHTGPPVTREPFASFEERYRTTGNFGLALDDLKTRLADPVADRIIETLRMSREVGGAELTTVLRNLGTYLRQDAAVRAEAEARQSWVVNAARLGVAAPWVILLLLATRPEAAAAYNSAAGSALIIGGAVVTLLAYRVMLAVGRLPDERRWFA